MAKTRKDIANGIKETTRQMYEKTLSEMREKGVDKDTIETVEKLKNSLDDRYKDVWEGIPRTNEERKECSASDFICGMPFGIDPLKSNLFVVELGSVPYYLVNGLDIDFKENELTVSVYETTEFSPLSYFTNNKTFHCMAIDFYNRNGNFLRRDRVFGLVFKNFESLSFSYSDERPFSTSITFKFDKYEPAR